MPIDYKFHCFHGEPKFVLVCSDRNDSKSFYDYFDLQWNNLDYSLVKNQTAVFRKPKMFDEMIKISRSIAEDFPFVRVDLYQTKGRIYIGELTFVPAGGLDDTLTQMADSEIGNFFHLNLEEML